MANEMEATSVATSNEEETKSDDTDYQLVVVIVLSTILVLLLIYLPFIMIRLYRRRPRRRRVLYIESSDPTKKAIVFDDADKRKVDGTDNTRQIKLVNAMNMEEINALDRSQHIYHTINDSLLERINKTLPFHEDVGGGDELDMVEATGENCDRDIVDVHTTEAAYHGGSNAKKEHLGIYCAMNVSTHDHTIKKNEKCEMPSDKDLENVYIEPDYLNMSAFSAFTAKYRRLPHKKRKANNVGSLYTIHRPRKTIF